MNGTMGRFLVEYNRSDDDFRTLLVESCRLAMESPIKLVTLVVPTKKNFPNTDIAGFIGQKESKKLCAGEHLSVGNGVAINLDISQNLSSFKEYGVVVAVYIFGKDLDKFDAIRKAHALIYFPWDKSEGVAWASTYSAKTLGHSSWEAEQNYLPVEVVKELERITAIVNLSTGLAHPLDKERTKEAFKKLRATGFVPEPEQIRRWAVLHGWEPRHATSLADLASKYFK